MSKTVTLNGRKIAAIALSAVLLVGGSVAGTMAYLTSQDAVVNTFTVGNVAISLDEAEVTEMGEYKTTVDARTDNNTYKLIPGHEYIKDPVVYVSEDSEACWLFVDVQIDPKLVALLDGGVEESTGNNMITKQMEENGWTRMYGGQDIFYRLYDPERYTESGEYFTFTSFKIADDVDADDLAALGDSAAITVKAYAVQYDGFDELTSDGYEGAFAAWESTFGAPSTAERE